MLKDEAVRKLIQTGPFCLGAAAACLLVCTWLSPCLAGQDNTPDEARLESLTVTAQKREENPQKVSATISTLSDVQIEDAHIQSTQDIKGLIPNLKTVHAGSRDYFSRIAIRGISNSGMGDPAVALYIDGVSYADVYAFNLPLFDIERIEVLKGPQGTLYGKNTEAGAINIVTKDPGNAFCGKASLEIGDYSKRQVSALLNVPVMEDKLFFRFTGLKSSRDGFVKNVFTGGDVDNQDTVSGRASMIYKPSKALTLDLTFNANRFEDDGGFPMVPLDKARYAAAAGLTHIDDFQTAYNYIGDSRTENSTTSFKMNYEAPAWELISITALRYLDGESTMDGDFTPADLYVGFNGWDSRSLSQELRIQSTGRDESRQWLMGVYYADDEIKNKTGYKLGQVYADYMKMPLHTEDKMAATLGARCAALFGQSTLRFFDDALGITAGLRYERAERSMERRHTFGNADKVPAMDLEKDYDEILPKLALDYRLADHMMAFASAARGYKAGGFSYAVDNPSLVSYDPEVSTAFELGFKSEFPEYGLRLNMAAFYTKVDDYQDRVQIDPMNIVQANATEVEIYGLELESVYAVTDALTLRGSFGCTKATYDEYVDPMTKENYKDNDVALIPQFDLGMALEYRNAWGLFSVFEWQHTGSGYLDRSNDYKQDGYSIFNAKIGYETENWDIYLAVRNLTDEQCFLDGFPDRTLGYMGTVSDPRTVSMMFNLRF